MNEFSKKRFLKYSLVTFWMILIFILSGELGSRSGSLSGSVISDLHAYAPSLSEQVATIAIRKSAHIFMYGVLGVFIANLLRDYKMSSKKIFGYGLLIAGLYASIDEIHQYFVGGRSSSPGDVLIDMAGATIGICVYYGFLKILQSHHSSFSENGSDD